MGQRPSARIGRRILWTVLSGTLLSPLPRAQSVAWEVSGGAPLAASVLWEVTAGAPMTAFGDEVRSAGDFDGDGIEDLLVGEPGFVAGPVQDAGRVAVFSGATQALLVEFIGTNPAVGFQIGGGLGGELGRPGDVTGDGIIDFPIPVYGGAPCLCPGTVEVSSGAGSRLGAWPGYTCAAVGDLDGDGIEDLVVGQPLWNPPTCTALAGRAYAVSVPAGVILAEYQAPPCSVWQLGYVVEPLGDVTGDGLPDVAVGGRGTSSQVSRVNVYSGLGTTPVWTKIFPPAQVWRLASVGDVNGDGIGDLAVGEPFGGPGSPTPTITLGAVAVLSGADGGSIMTLYGYGYQSLFGQSLGRIGDVDGDGYADILAGAPRLSGWGPPTLPSWWPGGLPNHQGKAYVYSGATAAPLIEMAEPPPYDGFAVSLDGLGDLDGDDYPDFVVSEPFRALPNPGRVIAFSSAPAGVSVFGAGCAVLGGPVPRIAAWPSPTVGSNVTVHLSRAPSNVPAILGLGTSSAAWMGNPLPLSLGPFGLPGCELLVSPDVMLGVSTAGTAAAGNGRASLDVSVPANPSLSGAAVYAQWFVGNPGGAPSPGGTTRALELVVQP